MLIRLQPAVVCKSTSTAVMSASLQSPESWLCMVYKAASNCGTMAAFHTQASCTAKVATSCRFSAESCLQQCHHVVQASILWLACGRAADKGPAFYLGFAGHSYSKALQTTAQQLANPCNTLTHIQATMQWASRRPLQEVMLHSKQVTISLL